MKKYNVLFLLLFIIGIGEVFSQISDDDWTYFMVRDDVVKPSMTVNYEAALSDLRMFLKDSNVEGVHYITQLQDNYHYTHITKLDNLNDMDGGLRAFIKGEKKSAEFDLIWSDLNETIESYSYYVVKYEPDLSYVPDGQVWLEKAPYRRWNYLYIQPGTEKEVEGILKAWKNLYQNKGVKHGFRVFSGVIGLEQPVLILTTWGESPMVYQANLQDNMELLDDEGSILWMSMMEFVRKVETIEGWYLPQYSFTQED